MMFKRRPTDAKSATDTDTMQDVRTFVLVGHCFPDRFMLKSAVRRAVPDASIETVNDTNSLAKVLDSSHVLLVNRVLDGRFDTDSGIELIRQVTGDDAGPIAMLVSNFDDAQREAEEAGARPGFGKSNVYEAEATDRLRAAALVDG